MANQLLSKFSSKKESKPMDGEAEFGSTQPGFRLSPLSVSVKEVRAARINGR